MAKRNDRRGEFKYWYANEYIPAEIGSIDGQISMIPHDKALIRAEYSIYNPSIDPNIQGNPYKTLFLGRLNYNTTEETLRDVFEKYGEIVRLRIVRHVITNESRGYGFIEYKNENDFKAAYHETNRMKIDGRIILVEYERERIMKGWKPRRLGGGLGGRKESGQLRFGGRDRPYRQPILRKHHHK